MIINAILFAGFLFVSVGLFVIEAFTVVTHQPTISDRIQSMDRSFRAVGILITIGVTFLLFHFFGGQ